MKYLILLIATLSHHGLTRAQQNGFFTDNRDGTIYKTVTIGSKTWMAENLNHATDSGSYCIDDIPENCKIYGRLYKWPAAMEACPVGWHLPDYKEWMEINHSIKGFIRDKNVLRVRPRSGTGNQEAVGKSRFRPVLAGLYFRDDAGTVKSFMKNPGGYCGAGKAGYWWSAGGKKSREPSVFVLFEDFKRVYSITLKKGAAISVRCVKD